MKFRVLKFKKVLLCCLCLPLLGLIPRTLPPTARAARISPALKNDLMTICNRVKHRTLEKFTTVYQDGRAFVATGDIDDAWIRDSTIQMRSYLHVKQLRPLVERFIKTLAFYLVQDPYANSFRRHYKKGSEMLRRGGWVATGNWEPDSHAYFIHFLCDFGFFQDTAVATALDLILDTLIVEQNHTASPYTYPELPNNGKGSAVKYTGLVWGGFRPSDDAQMYGYNIPVNMFLHSALTKLQRHMEDNRLWKLTRGIENGISKYGIVNGEYVYEVDGLGNYLLADDANIPSLLSMPLLNYTYFNTMAYAKTRSRILSASNPFYYKGSVFEGVGSPHTPSGSVWPLAVITRAMTSTDPDEIARQLEMLILMTEGSGSFHESVNVNNKDVWTRSDFCWADSAFVMLIQMLFPKECSTDDFQMNKLQYD